MVRVPGTTRACQLLRGLTSGSSVPRGSPSTLRPSALKPFSYGPAATAGRDKQQERLADKLRSQQARDLCPLLPPSWEGALCFVNQVLAQATSPPHILVSSPAKGK